MTYTKWVIEHSIKHKKILEKLINKSSDEVISYFEYENMKTKEKDFCLLYKEDKKCHEMKNLNCYLCACPYFRFNDKGFGKQNNKEIFSFCSINSKKGKLFESKEAIHQDCSDCLIPHKIRYIKKVFNRDWNLIIKDSYV